jgi:hypothetical protein
MGDRRKFNTKRKIRNVTDPAVLIQLSARVLYVGNPAHKMNPGDFGLTPPASPRPDKTLCDGAKIFERNKAQSLLREGVQRGLISAKDRAGLPQNIWAVSDDGLPLEAQLDNQEKATYHGYPMPAGDPLRKEILRRWIAKAGELRIQE